MAALEDVLNQPPDPEKYVPIEAMQSVLSDRNLQSTHHAETHALAKVEAAVKDGYILPPMKAWATALCAKNEASFDASIAGSAPAYGHLLATTNTALPSSNQSIAERAQSEDAESVCPQLGLKVTALNN